MKKVAHAKSTSSRSSGAARGSSERSRRDGEPSTGAPPPSVAPGEVRAAGFAVEYLRAVGADLMVLSVATRDPIARPSKEALHSSLTNLAVRTQGAAELADRMLARADAESGSVAVAAAPRAASAPPEAAAIGNFNPHPADARLETETVGTWLTQALAPLAGDEVIEGGMVQIADDLGVLALAMLSKDLTLPPERVFASISAIESRLRVLAAIAAKTLRAAAAREASGEPRPLLG